MAHRALPPPLVALLTGGCWLAPAGKRRGKAKADSDFEASSDPESASESEEEDSEDEFASGAGRGGMQRLPAAFALQPTSCCCCCCCWLWQPKHIQPLFSRVPVLSTHLHSVHGNPLIHQCPLFARRG